MTRHERFFPPSRKAPLRAKYPGAVAIKRTVAAAKAAGIDVAGIEALPDGTIRLLDARLVPAPTGSLFDELEAKGKL